MARGARRLNAVVGLAVGQLQLCLAVGEEGGKASAEVEAARIQLGQTGDQGNGGGAFRLGQAWELGEEGLVVQGGEGRQQGVHWTYILRSTVRPGPAHDSFRNEYDR